MLLDPSRWGRAYVGCRRRGKCLRQKPRWNQAGGRFRSAAGTDACRRLDQSLNAKLLLPGAVAMYNTDADALSSFLRAAGFIFWSPG